MKFGDIFKNSFLQGFAGREIGTIEIFAALALTCVLACYIFAVYRVVTRKTFYSKNFNISLAVVSVITAAIILTIQSSLVVSLGMVGALSIVRFRTAVKEPMDLAFMFWSISIGIMCGAGMLEIAVISSMVITILVVVLEMIPNMHGSELLIVNIEDNDDTIEKLETAIKKHTSSSHVKSRNVRAGVEDIVYEVRTKEERNLARAVAAIEGVNSVSVLDHDGEIML